MLTSTHYPAAQETVAFEMGAWCTTEPTPESSCEMGIIAKAAGISNFAEMLTCTDKRPAFQKVRGLIQPNGIYQFAASKTARR